MKKLIVLSICLLCTVPTIAQDVDTSEVQKPETFEMEWEDSTVVMQKYFVVFLKAGSERNQSKEEAEDIQEQHLDYLSRMFKEGYTSITGPFGDDGEIRGIVVYNTATAEEAKRLAEGDPAVKAGRLEVEVHPWWAAKGSKLK